MLPTFLIIGAAKCGTTSLYYQLKQHPQVFMPDNKEPTFFSERQRGEWKRGLEWYESLFSGRKAETALGEASTSYSKAPAYGDAPRLIASTIPEVRLIYLIRDPIAQIISNYRHLLAFEGCRHSLEEVLNGHSFLTDWASYYRQISAYMEHFSREQLLVIFFEEYIADPVETARKACRFIGVDDAVSLPLEKAQNSAAGRRIERWRGAKATVERVLPRPFHHLSQRLATRPLPRPTMSGEMHRKVMATLAGDLESLSRFLDNDLSCWSMSRPA